MAHNGVEWCLEVQRWYHNEHEGFGMILQIELEREVDGRWIAEVPAVPGVMVYGATRDEAIHRAEALALKIVADRVEHGEAVPPIFESLFSVAEAR
jgi:predicted RNase H-like HicB family nuclease